MKNYKTFEAALQDCKGFAEPLPVFTICNDSETGVFVMPNNEYVIIGDKREIRNALMVDLCSENYVDQCAALSILNLFK